MRVLFQKNPSDAHKLPAVLHAEAAGPDDVGAMHGDGDATAVRQNDPAGHDTGEVLFAGQ